LADKNLLPLSPGLVLLVCAFLPAYQDGCLGTVYPIMYGPIAIPYALGLSVAIWSAAGKLGVQRSWPHWQLVAFGQLCYWSFGLVLVLILIAALSEREAIWPIGLPIVAWLLPLRPVLRSLGRGRRPIWRALVALSSGAYACFMWFAFWVLASTIQADPKNHVLFGTFIALMASLALLAVGLLVQRGQKADREPASARGIPAVRVERNEL